MPRWPGLWEGFTWFWMPLFSQITATLAGMIAGPALLAITGYPFLVSCLLT